MKSKLKRLSSWLLVAVVVTFLGVGVVGNQVAQAAKRNSGVLPPNSNAFGKSYGEWSATFGQWLHSLPADQHPLFETADCSEGQSGKVWFLGGTYIIEPEENSDPLIIIGKADRSCSVPPGKSLFFPIFDAGCNEYLDPGENLRECANELADYILIESLEVTIDGRALINLDHYRVESPLFTIGPLPEGNILDPPAPAGEIYSAASDGYYILLAPLSKGEHMIEFSGTAVIPDTLVFELDISYDITVTK